MKLNTGLIIEPHPENYNGYPFITLLQFRKEHYLTIIDDSDDEEIKAIVLDLCGPEQIEQSTILEIANEWYTKYRHLPVSIVFSIRGLSSLLQKIYRSFSIECTTRVIGPLPRYNMDKVPVVKRKRKKTSTVGVEIQNNTNTNVIKFL